MFGIHDLYHIKDKCSASSGRHRAAAGLLSLFLLVCAVLSGMMNTAFGDTQTGSDEKHILAIFSYTTSWIAEREVYNGLVDNLAPSVRVDLVFMDAKNLDSLPAEKITSEHVRRLMDLEKYDAVVAVDDDALNFIMKYRTRWFEDIPIIFNNINSRERAEETGEDPFITGIYESFFGEETVRAAKNLYPAAVRVVGISDHSITGQALNDHFSRIFDSIHMDHELLDMMEMSREEIIEKISSYNEDTILLYLNFTRDRDGNIYGLDESFRFLTDNTSLPLFRPDTIGVGRGVLGGCGGSFEEAGRDTASIVTDVLNGKDISQISVKKMEGRYVFDASLLKRYGISKAKLPSDTEYVNEKITFWSKYSSVLRPFIVILFLMIIIVVLLAADHLRLRTLVNSQNELSDAQLRRRKAETQTYAVGQFLSSVSHDLRTPLVSIIGYTDLALSETDEAKRTDYLEKIRTSGIFLTDLLSDTLDVSRIISGKSRINPLPTTFNKVTRSIITSVSETARKKRVRFYSRIEDGDTVIHADQMKLQRIILNLLTNAVRFTPEGGQVSMEIDHLPERVNGCNFKIMVTDTGIGMNKEFQKIMFEPFVQEHADLLHMGTQDGTGLGLTIVRNNVEQMGGFIEVESGEGKGTKMSVFLPIDIRERETIRDESGQDKSDADASGGSSGSVLRGMRVLIAEDSDMNTEVIRTMLSKKEVVCDCVSDGKDAFDTWKQAPEGTYDLILMDLRMPGMNGYEAARAIRSSGRADAGSVLIYALSADAYEHDVKRALDAGMNGHISKPIRPGQLYDVLAGLKNNLNNI